MTAIIITIGSELTDGRVVDTNTAWLAGRLEAAGLRVEMALSAPDAAAGIGQVLELAMKQKPALIVVAGGLGPTADDITAAAVARALALPLTLDRAAVIMVASVLDIPPEDLSPHQAKQATLPAGSQALQPAGTAPGFFVDAGDSLIVALPGVPWEMEAMWEAAMTHPRLRALLLTAAAPGRGSVSLYGVGEPQVDEVVTELLAEGHDGLDVSICARFREILVDVRFSESHAEAAHRLLSHLRQRFADHVFSGGEAIEEVIGRELARKGKTLATGESCTGGLLGAAITGVSGASEYYRGGVVAYHNDVKRTLLKVRQEILDNVGAVSEPVAQQLALGVRSSLAADYGIGITGIAGPGGGTLEKPVGLVYICASSETGDIVEGFNFPGGRDDVRRAAVVTSLHLLHRKLIADSTAF
ncbi:MAG: CinA family nicotinamide mononucleotide deamidase-related protein [Thermoleophilia bacterium]